jgi:hypothetical protein
MMKRYSQNVCLVLVSMMCSTFAGAAPGTIAIRGQLLDADGVALTGERAYAVQFHDAATDGAPLGGQLASTVTISEEGLFAISIAPPSEMLASDTVWYALAVDSDEVPNGVDGADWFTDRVKVGSVPFALQAGEAEHVDATAVGAGNVDDTELAALDGVTGSLQSQLAAKPESANVYTKTEIDTSQATQDATIAAKADSADVDATQATQDTAIAAKADSANVYTKTEIDTSQATQDTAIAAKADSANVYTKTEMDTAQATQDTAIAAKADSANVYTKTEIDTSQATQDAAIAAKASSADVDATQATQDTAIAAKADSADVYAKAEVYTKTEVDAVVEQGDFDQVRVYNLDPSQGSLLSFGPTDDCSIGIDPVVSGLVERDPIGFRLLGSDGQGCRLIFGPTMDSTVEVDPVGPAGLLLRDPNGIRILNPEPSGSPSLFFGSSDQCSLQVDLSVFLFSNDVDVSGTITADSFVQASSRELKKNVKPIDKPLDIINRLQGVSFEWIEELGGKADIGFVAEEVAEVLPELVTMNEDGRSAKGMKYGNLVAVAVEGIKEQQQLIDTLRNDNDSLRKNLQELESRFVALSEKVSSLSNGN